MTTALEQYRHLESELVYVRWVNQGLESEREDELLEEMEQLWWEMDDEERVAIEANPPRSLVRSRSAATTPRRLVDSDIDASPSSPRRVIAEAA